VTTRTPGDPKRCQRNRFRETTRHEVVSSLVQRSGGNRIDAGARRWHQGRVGNGHEDPPPARPSALQWQGPHVGHRDRVVSAVRYGQPLCEVANFTRADRMRLTFGPHGDPG